MAVYQGVRPLGGLHPLGGIRAPGTGHTSANRRSWNAGSASSQQARPAAGTRTRSGRLGGASPLGGAFPLVIERAYDGGLNRVHGMAIPRRRHTVHSRARRRQGRIGVALTGILVTFLLALFYLTQTVHVAATNYDIGSLLADRDRMNQQLQSLQGDIARLGAEHAVSGRAQELGLDPLGTAVWVGTR
jgi:hypothetical protein